MKYRTWALICSAAAVLSLGAILVFRGTVPGSAMSYALRKQADSQAQRAISLSIPALSPLSEGLRSGEEGRETVVSQAVFSPIDDTVFVPEAPSGAQKIVTKQYSSSLSVNNASPKKIDVAALLEKVPDIGLTDEGPQILIVHTHTSESYNETGQDWYGDEDTRSDEESRNMVRMGNVLETELSARGYSVIHCQRRHDEDFNSSYAESNQTIREYLKKYPSICVILDLHRDSLIDAAGTKYRPTVLINGEETAQIMFLMGVGNDTYPHPYWQENLSLALRIQAEGERLYPGLMRPVLVRPSRYNQYLSNGALLVELGACGNTPQEAERAAVLFAELCANAMDRIREEAE